MEYSEVVFFHTGAPATINNAFFSEMKYTLYVFFLLLSWPAVLAIFSGSLAFAPATSLRSIGYFICRIIYFSLFKKDNATDVWKKYEKNRKRKGQYQTYC